MMSTQALSTEAVMLLDQAIISVWGEYSTGLLSSHDRSPDLSFGEKVRPRASEKLVTFESATESRVNESHMTQTISVVTQVTSECDDSQQNPNSFAKEDALTQVSATLENSGSAAQLTTEPLADNGHSDEPIAHKSSTDLLLGERTVDAQTIKLSPEQPEEQINLLHIGSNTQGSIAQSTQEYTLTAASTLSLTTTIRGSSPRSLGEVLDQEWDGNDPMSESPSTHEKSPDYSFREQLEKYTETHKVQSRPIEDSFVMIEEGDQNDEPGEGSQPTNETTEQERSMLQKKPTAIDVMNLLPQSKVGFSFHINYVYQFISNPLSKKSSPMYSLPPTHRDNLYHINDRNIQNLFVYLF